MAAQSWAYQMEGEDETVSSDLTSRAIQEPQGESGATETQGNGNPNMRHQILK